MQVLKCIAYPDTHMELIHVLEYMHCNKRMYVGLLLVYLLFGIDIFVSHYEWRQKFKMANISPYLHETVLCLRICQLHLLFTFWGS